MNVRFRCIVQYTLFLCKGRRSVIVRDRRRRGMCEEESEGRLERDLAPWLRAEIEPEGLVMVVEKGFWDK